MSIDLYEIREFFPCMDRQWVASPLRWGGARLRFLLPLHSLPFVGDPPLLSFASRGLDLHLDRISSHSPSSSTSQVKNPSPPSDLRVTAAHRHRPLVYVCCPRSFSTLTVLSTHPLSTSPPFSIRARSPSIINCPRAILVFVLCTVCFALLCCSTYRSTAVGTSVG